MEWSIKRGRVYTTKPGTARAHHHYWIRHNGVGNFTAGYYGFGADITFTKLGTPLVFSTIHAAKVYCKAKDDSAVIIVGQPVTA